MTIYFILSIVFFSLSGMIFAAAIVVFFATDVISSLKYLINRSGAEDALIAPTVRAKNSGKAFKVRNTQTARVVDSESRIEYAQQTVDIDELNEHDSSSFETQDWDLPPEVSFVLTVNILVYHSEKEYLAH